MDEVDDLPGRPDPRADPEDGRAREATRLRDDLDRDFGDGIVQPLGVPLLAKQRREAEHGPRHHHDEERPPSQRRQPGPDVIPRVERVASLVEGIDDAPVRHDQVWGDVRYDLVRPARLRRAVSEDVGERGEKDLELVVPGQVAGHGRNDVGADQFSLAEDPRWAQPSEQGVDAHEDQQQRDAVEEDGLGSGIVRVPDVLDLGDPPGIGRDEERAEQDHAERERGSAVAHGSCRRRHAGYIRAATACSSGAEWTLRTDTGCRR